MFGWVFRVGYWILNSLQVVEHLIPPGRSRGLLPLTGSAARLHPDSRRRRHHRHADQCGRGKLKGEGDSISNIQHGISNIHRRLLLVRLGVTCWILDIEFSTGRRASHPAGPVPATSPCPWAFWPLSRAGRTDLRHRPSCHPFRTRSARDLRPLPCAAGPAPCSR